MNMKPMAKKTRGGFRQAAEAIADTVVQQQKCPECGRRAQHSLTCSLRGWSARTPVMGNVSVYDYFKTKLGFVPDDWTLRDLPCASVCGVDCVGAINCASMFLTHVKAAVGEGEPEIASVIGACALVCSVYWRG